MSRVTEILQQVERIQIVANHVVDELFAGHYRSVFRGQGMEFDEVREYQPGDDVRTIDWNVTARMGNCYIKRYCEERELTVLFLVDVSASQLFGTGRSSKLDVATEIAALLMFAALKNNNKVGLVTFGHRVEEYLPARKGKAHVLHLIRQLVDAHPAPGETNLRVGLELLNRVQKRHAVVFLISDFLAEFPRQTLSITNQRHDLTAITIVDRREWELPAMGIIRLHDPETGQLTEVDSSSSRVRQLFARQGAERTARLSKELSRIRVDQLTIHTHEEYLAVLRAFFRMREKRFRA